MILDDDQELLVEAKPGRCSGRPRIVVEPLLIMYVAAGLPLMTIRSQFMYQKVAEFLHVDLSNLTTNTSNCDVNQSDPNFVTRQHVQSETANLNMYLSLSHFLPKLIFTIIYGSIGDRIGRRLLLILPCIGSILLSVLYMCIIKFNLSVYFFFLEVVENFFGGMETLFLGAFAYLADTVPKEKLSFRMTVLDVVSLGNGAIASLFIGYWIETQGFFWPLVFVASGKTLALGYAIFFIPETVTSSPQSRKMSLQGLFGALNLVLKDNGTGKRWNINILLLSYTVGTLISAFSILTLYEMNSPLCWGSVLIGYYNCVSMLVKCVAMLFAAGVLRRFVADHWQILLGRISSLAEYIYLTFVLTSVMMFIVPVLGCLSFLSIPMTRAVLSTLVGKDEQASVFSMMAVCFALTNLVSSVATNKIYAASLMFMEGLVFLVDAATQLIAAALICLYIYKCRNLLVPLKRMDEIIN